MRILTELLSDLFSPRKTGARTGRERYLRLLLVVAIALACGPEVFAAADLILLVDLLGATLFLTAFAAGYRMFGLALLARLRALVVPSVWADLINTRGHPSLVTHGVLLIGTNALRISVMGLSALAGIAMALAAIT